MRKYIKILMGLIRLFVEKIINGKKLVLHGYRYCISSGVKLWVHNSGKLDLGKKTWLSENCLFECNGGKINIGFNNFFNSNCRIISLEKVIVGDNNLFGPNVVIVDHNHNYKCPTELICKQGFSSEKICIGSNNWICANVVICKGVEIGSGIVVAANSVVLSDCLVPGVYAGSPARLIKSKDNQ